MVRMRGRAHDRDAGLAERDHDRVKVVPLYPPVPSRVGSSAYIWLKNRAHARGVAFTRRGCERAMRSKHAAVHPGTNRGGTPRSQVFELARKPETPHGSAPCGVCERVDALQDGWGARGVRCGARTGSGNGASLSGCCVAQQS